ncbi:MAG TPA: 5-(carboxyamino)imidazole ribonucleotide synthase [Terriglobia bacterium]|nr:5-(carboxyamino)imidazole ribonucleotide synthase [Terriglobia bacterium]
MKIGVLGGGQLGRMMALAGYPLGFVLRFLDKTDNSPAGQVSDCVAADFNDTEALTRFAQGLDAVTYEFENIPASAAHYLSEHVPRFLPPPHALEIAQDRLRQKQFFQKLGIPAPRFYAVESRGDLERGLEFTGLPAVLKTQRWGYDGKGQTVLRQPAEIDAAWAAVGGAPTVLEGFIRFEREVSLVSVRSPAGQTAFYPLTENHHREGILRLSLAPAPEIPQDIQEQAQNYARKIFQELDYAGVLTIEFFYVEGKLLANEMATRVHNSGHWTIEGTETSQFENHLRAIAGLPLGSTRPRGFSAMVNFIGCVPARDQVLEIPGVHLHLYGKKPRPGRKLGHATVCAPRFEELAPALEKLQKLAGC